MNVNIRKILSPSLPLALCLASKLCWYLEAIEKKVSRNAACALVFQWHNTKWRKSWALKQASGILESGTGTNGKTGRHSDCIPDDEFFIRSFTIVFIIYLINPIKVLNRRSYTSYQKWKSFIWSSQNDYQLNVLCLYFTKITYMYGFIIYILSTCIEVIELKYRF